jgi:chloride channel protein, CIC family
MRNAELLRLVVFGAIIGIPAALLSLLFFTAVHYLEHVLWTDLPAALGSNDPPAYLIVALPAIGGLVVAAARLLLPGDGGSSPLTGMAHEPTPVRHVPGIVLAALGTLGFGLVLGPEMPVMAVGAATGVALANVARVAEREAGVLSAAGQFAAISTLFGGPLVGGVMVTESGIGLGRRLIPLMLPGFVAAAIGYLVFVGLGPYTGAPTPSLTVPDLEPIGTLRLIDLALAIAAGVVTAVVIGAVNRGARSLAAVRDARFAGGRSGVTMALLIGGLAVGLVAVLAEQLGASSEDVLFSGQSSIPTIAAQTSVAALAILLVAKAIGYIISLAAGFRGGPIFPALFLGIAIAAFAIEWFAMSPTTAIAIGAASGMAAQTRLLLTSMLFAAILVGTAGSDAIPAIVLATVAAYVTAAAIDPREETE